MVLEMISSRNSIAYFWLPEDLHSAVSFFYAMK
jgi:hypothetical protein